MSIYLGENKVEMVGGTPIVVDGVDTSDANAVETDILATKTAYVKGVRVTGKMTNNGSISKTMNGIDTKSVSIPSGYTSGGTVSLTDDIDNEVGDQADLISQIMTELEGKAAGGGGIDTSAPTDQAVTASDMAVDKIAYVNGEQVVGELPVWTNFSFPNITPTWDDTNKLVLAKGTFDVKRIYNKGGVATLKMAASNFGDATAADVVSGKYFTSAEGLKIPGKHVCSGGSGGLVMKTGTITLDATAENLVIDTGLSDVSSILITHAQPSVSSTYGWSYSWDAIYGLCLFRSQAQYMSYNYGTRTPKDNYITKDGGIVTAIQHSSTYPVASGEFAWTAYGTE